MDLSRYTWPARLIASLTRRLAFLANIIIVNSDAGLRYLSDNGYPIDKLVYVPNGIDLTVFYRDDGARSSVRRSWGLTEADLVIGIVARLDPMKDHRTFLRAAARVLRQFSSVTVVCFGIGKSPLRQELQDLCRHLQIEHSVLWLGPCSNMRAVYNALDIVCLSSAFGEGFPNVIGEAMACGRRCVVTDVGDCRPIVGPTGWVVPPGDADALADGLMQALREIRRTGSFSIEARDRICQNFTVALLANRVETAILPGYLCSQSLG
jgi:glycosyltransferase involved in cell wall biosynthesis